MPDPALEHGTERQQSRRRAARSVREESRLHHAENQADLSVELLDGPFVVGNKHLSTSSPRARNARFAALHHTKQIPRVKHQELKSSVRRILNYQFWLVFGNRRTPERLEQTSTVGVLADLVRPAVASPPRWTAQNRPSIDTSKPATTGVASETNGVLLRGLLGAQVGLDFGAPAPRSAFEDVRVEYSRKLAGFDHHVIRRTLDARLRRPASWERRTVRVTWSPD